MTRGRTLLAGVLLLIVLVVVVAARTTGDLPPFDSPIQVPAIGGTSLFRFPTGPTGPLRVFGSGGVDISAYYALDGQHRSTAAVLIYNAGDEPAVVTGWAPIDPVDFDMTNLALVKNAPGFTPFGAFPGYPPDGEHLDLLELPVEVPPLGREIDPDEAPARRGHWVVVGYRRVPGVEVGRARGFDLTYTVGDDTYHLPVRAGLEICRSVCPS